MVLAPDRPDGYASGLLAGFDAGRPTHRETREWATPGALAMAFDPYTRQTPALELIDAALVDVVEGRCERLIITVPPQEGKSTRVSRWFVLWALLRNPRLRCAIASYEFNTARRWGRAIRNDIKAHSDKLGVKVSSSTSAAFEWELDGHPGGVYCVGIGGAITGRPVDLLVIDDPVKDRKQAESEAYRQAAWDWWTDAAVTRLSPGAPVIVVQTRWHEDDLAGKLIRGSDDDPDKLAGRWRVLNIPAQADHRPEKGETDPLGREPGEWLQSARGRTPEQWEAKRLEVGTRTFTALYQGRPTPTAGEVWKRPWWRRYTQRLWRIEDGTRYIPVDGFDEVILSWDMAFKDTKASDYVCGQVWARRGAEVFLLDQVHARMSFPETLRAFQALAKKWPTATAKVVEDKANGPAVIASVKRRISGVIAETPVDSKLARAWAVAPFVEAGNVLLPDPDAGVALFDVEAFIDEAAAFPNGKHDDQVDAASQALRRMLLKPGQGQVWKEYLQRRLARRAQGEQEPDAPQPDGPEPGKPQRPSRRQPPAQPRPGPPPGSLGPLPPHMRI